MPHPSRVKVTDVIITPVAFRDPPLLNALGVHEAWALRTIVQVETNEGFVGLGETYGDALTLDALTVVSDLLVDLDPFDLNGLRTIIDTALHVVEPDEHALIVAPGTSHRNLANSVFGAFEVAFLDLQGQSVGRPISDLLGGAIRPRVDFAGYLFYKFARHIDEPDDAADDPWGEALTPEGIVEQARTMVDHFGFRSLKLKAGVFDPDVEIATILKLAETFPDHPLRLDPNTAWTVDTSIDVGRRLRAHLDYLEDPTEGARSMAQVAQATGLPIATNMLVTHLDDVPEAIEQGAVQILLSDHHYWGGLRATQHVATLCGVWDIGVSMHSNSHLGISLAAMAHVASATPGLTYACDTHYPWLREDVIQGGLIRFEQGAFRVPTDPGLGVRLDHAALDRMHQQYRDAPVRSRNDVKEMQKYDPSWTGTLPRF